MKLRIEKWVEDTKPFSAPVNELFTEAVNNYKFGSYRSAFIMAYLSFKLTIRERIINCTYGSELKKKNPNFWQDDILAILNNDDKWEEQINNIVMASCAPLNSRKEIGILNFGNGELAKTEYCYWREKRNACVHGKNQIIDSSTVESFWNYLVNNLSQFYVLGGEEYLVRELANIYEYYKYPDISNRDRIDGILDGVSTVFQNHAKEFFDRFFKGISKGRNYVDDDNKDFWNSIIHSRQESIVDGFVNYIACRGDIFFELYPFFPELLEQLVAFDPKFIIQTLSSWLKGFSGWCVAGNETFWRVLVDALGKYNDQMDINQIVNENTIRLIKDFSGKENDVAILNRYGVFKRYILKVSDWYFKTDSDSQFKNFSIYHNDFSNIEICFSLLQWDADCLNRLEDSLNTLKRSLPARDNLYSQTNGRAAMNSFKRIIYNSQAKIEEVINGGWSYYESIHEIIESAESI